jgi:hypothetical protein
MIPKAQMKKLLAAEQKKTLRFVDIMNEDEEEEDGELKELASSLPQVAFYPKVLQVMIEEPKEDLEAQKLRNKLAVKTKSSKKASNFQCHTTPTLYFGIDIHWQAPRMGGDLL